MREGKIMTLTEVIEEGVQRHLYVKSTITNEKSLKNYNVGTHDSNKCTFY